MSIIHPATVIISGGTGSGKTYLTKKLLEHHKVVFIGLPQSPKVIWCYGVEHAEIGTPIANVDVRYVDHVIDNGTLKASNADVVVIDDFMSEKANDSHVHNLFTKFSHHLNLTVIYITQNLYEKGQCKMKRNAHYLILTRNPSDKSQITTLGRQLFPRRKENLYHFYESYDDATKDKFGYLFIDVSPQSIEKQKLKTNVLPDQNGNVNTIVYFPKHE